MSNPDREWRERQRQIAATRPQRPQGTRLGALAAEIIAETGAPAMALAGDPDTEITGLSLSSQRILDGDLYAALPGSRVHGIEYVEDAVEEGAVAILTDQQGIDRVRPNSAVLSGIPVLVAADPRALLGRLAARIYGEPASAMRMIGEEIAVLQRIVAAHPQKALTVGGVIERYRAIGERVKGRAN